MAPPTPRLKGSRQTIAPASSARRAVPSAEPSSTTRMSTSGQTERTSRTVAPTAASSFHAGITTRTRWDGVVGSMPGSYPGATGRSATPGPAPEAVSVLGAQRSVDAHEHRVGGVVDRAVGVAEPLLAGHLDPLVR